MDEVFKDAAAEAPDPRLIPGIYNYCHMRCDECAFTDRCLTFRRMREDETRHPDRNTLEHVHANLTRTGELVKTWCESAGIDFDALREDARSEETASTFRSTPSYCRSYLPRSSGRSGSRARWSSMS